MNQDSTSQQKTPTRFTPGPWSAEFATNKIGDSFPGYMLVNAHDERGVIGVADCFGEVRGVTDEETGDDVHIPDAEVQGNARLIAAAPDLYAACKALSKISDDIYAVLSDGEALALRAAWASMDAAIAKAEGK